MIKINELHFFLKSLIDKQNLKLSNNNYYITKNPNKIRFFLKKNKIIFFILKCDSLNFSKIFFFLFCLIIKEKISTKNIYLTYEFKNLIQINEIIPKKNIIGINKIKLIFYLIKYIKNLKLILIRNK